MLPRSLYKSLPYLYIVTGLLCWAAIDSNIALIPSVLLVSAGLLVLWMRHKAKQELEYGPPVKASVEEEYQLRERIRRLPETDQKFPITDDGENMIAFNRRAGERRKEGED
jgi:hypothetical protein